jgi:hypothetical protein
LEIWSIWAWEILYMYFMPRSRFYNIYHIHSSKHTVLLKSCGGGALIVMLGLAKKSGLSGQCFGFMAKYDGVRLFEQVHLIQWIQYIDKYVSAYNA